MNNNNKIFNTNSIKLPNSIEDVTFQYLIIDSSDSNSISISEYDSNISERLNYVSSIEIVDWYIPFSDYNITKHNNSFYFQESEEHVYRGTNICVEISEGKYDINTLLETLEYELNKKSEYFKFKLRVNNINNKIEIKGILKYQSSHNSLKYPILIFENVRNSIGRNLGFNYNTLNENNISQHPYNLQKTKYISLFLTTDNGESINQVIGSKNSAIGAFAIIQSFNGETKPYNINFKKEFNPPVSFTKLKVKFIDDEGNLYDFNGKNHYILFQIKRIFGRQKITGLDNLY